MVEKVTIELLFFLREEQKFNSIEDLIIQLNLDKVNALFYLTNNPA